MSPRGLQTEKAMCVISVMVPSSLRDELHVAAKEDGRSLSGQVRWLLQQHLKERA